MARKFFINNKDEFKINNNIKIDGEEFNHIVNVLRYKVDDEITIINGSGIDYNCKITEINKKNLNLLVKDSKNCNAESSCNFTVFQALVKGEKFELIMQKLTELGITKLVPFYSEYCQIKPNTTRLDRLEKISIEALKQSGRSKLVEINKVVKFDEMLNMLTSYDAVIFAYEKADVNLTKNMILNSDNKPFSNVAIIVGCEGGFSENEVDKLKKINNVKMITMGNRILRAETASIALTSVVMYLLGEWDK